MRQNAVLLFNRASINTNQIVFFFHYEEGLNNTAVQCESHDKLWNKYTQILHH